MRRESEVAGSGVGARALRHNDGMRMFSDIIPMQLGTADGEKAGALDIFADVLKRADNPRALERFLCREIQRLTDAGYCALLHYPGGAVDEPALRQIHPEGGPCHPPRSLLEALGRAGAGVDGSRLVRPGDAGDTGDELARLVREAGRGPCALLPLGTSGHRTGMMVLLGVEDGESLAGLLADLEPTATLIGLILDNAISFHDQRRALKRRTQELATSRHVFRALSQVAPTGIFRADNDGNVIFMNDRMAGMLGVPGGGLAAAEWRGMIYEQDRKAVMAAWERIRRRGDVVSVENRLRTRGGDVIWVSLQAMPEVGEDGAVSGYIGMITDITERRRTMGELKRSESEYRSIFETAAQLIMSVDADGAIIDVNGRSRGVLGYAQGELLGQPLAKVIQSGYHEKIRVLLAPNRRAGRIEPQDIRMVRKDGAVIDARLNASIIDAEVPGAARATCIIEDVSQRKRTEEALRVSEAKFRALTENTTDITMVLDTRGAFTYISPALARITETPLQELIGTQFGSFIHPADMISVREYIDNAARSPGLSLRLSDLRVRHQDGGWRHLSATVTGMLDVPGVNGIVINCRDISDRKNAEDELRKFKTISDRSSHGAVITDLDGGILYANRAYAEAHGYGLREILGRNRSIFHGEEQLRRVNEQYARVLREGGVKAVEVWHRRKDGTVFPCLLNATLIRDDGGRPLFISATIVDVTELKLAERALKESRRQLATLLGNLPGMAYRCRNDRRWTMDFVSQGSEALTGYAPARLQGSEGVTYSDIIHEEDRERVWEDVQEALAHKAPFEIQYRIVTAGGDLKWAWEQGMGVFDRKGELRAIEGFVSDITGRVDAERERSRSQKRYRTLFNMMLDGFALHELVRDESGRACDYVFLEVNPSFEAVTGLMADDVLGRRAGEVMPGLEPTWVELYAQVVESGEPLRFEKYSAVLDRHFEVFAYRMQDEQFATVFRDVTERKKAEDKARSLTMELERRVSERTAELWEANSALQDTNRALRSSREKIKATQAQLIESKKMAALGGLVAGVAHEINTPVGVGVTAASHLAEKTESFGKLLASGALKRSELQQYLDICAEASRMILANLKRAAELIQSFKQVAVDRTSQKRREFVLGTFFDEVLLSLKPALKLTEHRVEVVCEEGLAMDSYPGALSQILTNFVMNSLLHGFDENEAGTLRIEAAGEGDMVRLRYADDGRGMDARVREKIFEPFFTTKRGQGGSGLGMHLVYNLVTQTLGGRIECVSSPGEGTAFTIMMPRIRSEEDHDNDDA